MLLPYRAWRRSMTMLLDLVRGLLLAPVYVVLSAAALLQMRDGLDKLTSFVRDPAAGPTGIVLTIKPVLVHIEVMTMASGARQSVTSRFCRRSWSKRLVPLRSSVSTWSTFCCSPC